MSSSVIYNKDDKHQLYCDLHSMTVQFVPSATVRMVKTTVTSLASGSYDCSALALKLYWILSNQHFTKSPATQYLVRVRELTGEPVDAIVSTITTEQSLREMIEQEGMQYREVGGDIYADDLYIGAKALLVGYGTIPVQSRVHAVCTRTDDKIEWSRIYEDCF